MSLSSFTLGYGLNSSSLATVSAVSMISFVSAFAVGLGPVPFVLLAELPPPHARSAIASIGLAINWGLNICVVRLSLATESLHRHADTRLVVVVLEAVLTLFNLGFVLSSSFFATLGRYADGERVLYVWSDLIVRSVDVEKDVVIFCNRVSKSLQVDTEVREEYECVAVE